MSSADVEKYIPVGASLRASESVILQRIDDAFVLMSCKPIGEVGFFDWDYPVRLLFLNAAAFRVMKKDCTGPIFESAFQLEGAKVGLVFGCGSILFAVDIYAIVQLLVIHPDAFECFFAI